MSIAGIKTVYPRKSKTKKANNRSKWFGVKTFYEIVVLSSPKRHREKYIAQSSHFEERVVLFKTSNFSEAIKLAEKEAKSYQLEHTNPFGQKVSHRYLGWCDVFWLFENPAHGVEVYSMIEDFDRKVKKAEYLKRKFGSILRNADKIRSKILDSQFSSFQ